MPSLAAYGGQQATRSPSRAKQAEKRLLDKRRAGDCSRICGVVCAQIRLILHRHVGMMIQRLQMGRREVRFEKAATRRDGGDVLPLIAWIERRAR